MDALETSTAAPRSYAWIGRAAFEAALIVFGLVGAFLIDEWRESRARAERVGAALASIRAELADNEKAVAAAIENHDQVIAQLKKAAETRKTYYGGIIFSPPFSSVAWEAARDAAITNDIDHATLMSLGHAYRSLDAYEDERTVFLNYLYTNNTQNLRENPLGLAGWLSDMRRHARGVQDRLGAASRGLRPQPATAESP